MVNKRGLLKYLTQPGILPWIGTVSTSKKLGSKQLHHRTLTVNRFKLDGWSHTEIVYSLQIVTHPSTNRDWRVEHQSNYVAQDNTSYNYCD